MTDNGRWSPRRAAWRRPWALLCGGAVLAAGACQMPRGERWDAAAAGIEGGVDILCGGDPSDDATCVVQDGHDIFVSCEPEQEFFRIVREDCTARGQVCTDQPPYEDCESFEFVEGASAIGCEECRPCSVGCLDGDVARCLPDGTGWEIVESCRIEAGEACESGRCVSGCAVADSLRSNVGCEYWAVDLDNAVVQGLFAAAQQFAVVVSNPSDSVDALVTVEICHAQPCSDPDNLEVVAESLVNRSDLEVFALDPREVDGSEPGTYDTGAGTALGPQAYRVTSNWPIIAYQFNPLENVDVFSNDASLLLPTSALDERYSVLSWPQTQALVPGSWDRDMGQDLRTYLTVVGVTDDTVVTIAPTADIIPSGEADPVIPFTRAGETLEVTLNAFDVLNLETGFYDTVPAFHADFTGTTVVASAPVVVFTGTEATDVPVWDLFDQRSCCGDHIEQQQWPERTLGFNYVVAHTPPRTLALREAGVSVMPFTAEPEWFRVLALEDETVVTTTLLDEPILELGAMESRILESDTHFVLRSNGPLALGQFVGGQDTTGIPPRYPGGDPAFILVPPVEQWRPGYVFLTPDKYDYDYLMIAVSREHASQVELDGENVSTLSNCFRERADGLRPDEPTLPDYYVITCALSAPVWSEEEEDILPGVQDDGPHEVYARGSGARIGIVVYGFDRYVSYGYAGGTDLRLIQ